MIFTPFRQKRKTFDKRNVLGTFLNQNRQNAAFPLWGSEKLKCAHFSLLGRFWRPKRSGTQKWAQKRKKRFWAFWAPKTCPERYVYHCFALGAKMMLFCVLLIFALFRFLGAKSVFGVQKWSKTLKTLKIHHFALFCEKGVQNT